jgi:hypothetical protein
MASIACGRCGIYHDEGLHLHTGEKAPPIDYRGLQTFFDQIRALQEWNELHPYVWPDQYLVPLPPTQSDLPWWATPPSPSTRHSPMIYWTHDVKTGEPVHAEWRFRAVDSTGNVGS